MALVEAMAGMMFLTTPWVSWYVTPCRKCGKQQQQGEQREACGASEEVHQCRKPTAACCQLHGHMPPPVGP